MRGWIWTGRRMAADEALRWGLVNRVAATHDAALAAGWDLARTIVATSPMAVTGTKRSLNHSRGRPVADGLRDAAMWNAAMLANADRRAIATAKARKTAPDFADLG